MTSTVPADGTRLRGPHGISLVEHRPSGAPSRAVLLLHGIGGNATSCTELGVLLAERAGARTLSWDAPGYGESEDPAGAVDHVEMVLEVIRSFELEQVDVVGTSWGGVIATCLAARHPERVRSLVLADSTRGSAVTEERAAAMRGRVDELARDGAEALAAARAGRLVSPATPADVAVQVREEMARIRLAGYAAAAEFMASTDTGELLPQLTVPTLVLVGEDDVVTGVPESRLLAKWIPGARLEILPRAGHAAITERPSAAAELVIDFWEGQA